jgi:hypothetical protein
MRLWQLSLLTLLAGTSVLAGIVAIESARFGPAAGTCLHDGSTSICPNPAQE